MSLIKKVQQHIHQHRLFKQDDRLLLAVSGGLDSMLLLEILHQLGYNITVAHCNFKLRGVESDTDAIFVEEYCTKIKVPVYQHSFQTDKYAIDNKISIQMAARDLRYQWFDELCVAHGYTSIVTAHHANDHAETILLNLIRGTGLSGLKGIAERNGNIIRPLLPFTRKELDQYALSKNLKWREDSSNQSKDYQRNLIRLEVLPILKQINPSLEKTLIDFSKIMLESSILIEEFIEHKLHGLIYEEINSTVLKTETIADHAALNSLLHPFLSKFQFNADVIATITTAIRENRTGKIFFSKNFRVLIDRNQIIITSLQNVSEELDIIVEEGNTVISLPDGLLRMQLIDLDLPIMLQNKDPKTAYLDAGMLNYPMLCRRWIKGDYFYPLGLEHRQKLSDYFIDHKVPLTTKEISWVLMAGEDIAWVIGQRIDQRYRLTEKTEQVLALEWRPHGTDNAL